MPRYEVPLTSVNQKFSITLNSVKYNMVVRWNLFAQAWVLDIYNSNGNKMLMGVPLVTGVDLLAQYKYLNFGGALIVATDSSSDVMPTIDNLGSGSHFYFTTP